MKKGTLGKSNNTAAKIQTFMQIEQLLELNENKEKLWEYDWLEWCSSFLGSGIGPNNEYQLIDVDSSNIIDRIIQKMFLYELGRKTSRFLTLKEIIDNLPFQIHVIELIIEYFDENPSLPNLEGPDIILNLSLLYKGIQHMESVSIGLFYSLFPFPFPFPFPFLFLFLSPLPFPCLPLYLPLLLPPSFPFLHLFPFLILLSSFSLSLSLSPLPSHSLFLPFSFSLSLFLSFPFPFFFPPFPFLPLCSLLAPYYPFYVFSITYEYRMLLLPFPFSASSLFSLQSFQALSTS